MPDISELIADLDITKPRAALMADFVRDPDKYVDVPEHQEKFERAFYRNPLYQSADPLFMMCLYSACADALEADQEKRFSEGVRAHLNGFTQVVDVEVESCADRFIPVMRTAYRGVSGDDERGFSEIFKKAAYAIRRFDALFPEGGIDVTEYVPNPLGRDGEAETLKLAGFQETPRGYVMCTPEPGAYRGEGKPTGKKPIELE